MKWTYVLKDKGTYNQGWWLKITNIDELTAYYETVSPEKYGNAFENYIIMGPDKFNHGPHQAEVPITDAIIRTARINKQTFFEAMHGFRITVATNQIEALKESGAVYINKAGGYHGAYESEPEYDTVVIESTKPEFPDEDYTIDFPSPKVEEPTSEYIYGWLSPMGDFYEAEWGNHEAEAQSICEKLGIDNTDIRYESRQLLSEKGWILLHDPANSNKCLVTFICNPTKQQQDFLYGYFIDRGETRKAEQYIEKDYEER